MNITVTVIIPNYNHFKYLKQRIDSVLTQTFQDFEILIMDDKSTDNSRTVIEEYRNHPKVSQIIYNEENSGSTFKQWNKGVSQAKGNYIWIAESDDIADPKLLETLVSSFIDSRDTVLSFCQSYRMNADNKVTGTWLKFMKDTDSKLFNQDFLIDGTDFVSRSLIFKNTIPNASSLLFSKDAYEKIDGAAEDLKYCSDWLTWIKIACCGKVAYHQKPLNYFRYHSTSVIAQSSRSGEFFLKKYDIQLRMMLNDFLDTEKIKYKSLIDKNNELLTREMKIEKIAESVKSKSYLSIFRGLIGYYINNIDKPREILTVTNKIKNYFTA